MSRPHLLPFSLRRLASSALAIALGAIALQPSVSPAQLTPPGVAKALDGMLEGAGDPQLAKACRSIRDQLSKSLPAKKRAPWDELQPPAELDTAEKLSAKIDQLSDGRTLDEFVRHLCDYLLRYPERADYPQRLWELAAITASIEQEGEPSPLFSEPISPLLFDAAESLPETDSFRLEIALLAARHHHALGDFGAEEKKLRGILRGEGLPAPVRVAARSLLGVCLESQDRYDEALEVYRQAENALAVYPAAFDTTLRAALIHLAHGRREAATKRLEKLADADPALRKLSRSARDIDALVELLDDGPESLERYWDHSAAWWPAWVELRATLGHARPADELRLPDLPSIHGLGPALAADIGRGADAEFYAKLDLVMHALRHTPSVIGEAGAALCFLAPQLSPDHSEAIYSVVVQMCADFPSPTPGLSRSAQLYQTVAYSDSGQPDRALEVIEAFREADSDPDELSETMIRLWAHLCLAEKRDLDKPRAALEELLDADRAIQNRAQTVLYLAQIYDKLDLAEEEFELLNRELQNPAVLADQALAAGFRVRRQEIDPSAKDGGVFRLAVAEWREQHAPGWLAFALPKGLDDPRIEGRSLAELLDPDTLSATGIGAEGRVQLELLAAESGELDLATRDRAFRSAFAVLFVTAPRHSEARKMLRAVLRDDRFPNRSARWCSSSRWTRRSRAGAKATSPACSPTRCSIARTNASLPPPMPMVATDLRTWTRPTRFSNATANSPTARSTPPS